MTNIDTVEDPTMNPSERSVMSRVVDDVNVDELVANESGSKTWSRIFVENFLINFKWYNPNVGKTGDNVPDLKKSWAYFEHFTLARYKVGDGDKTRYERAKPGERGGKGTELYPVLRLPMKQLNDWGIGVGLYFTELRAMMFILLCAGLICLSNILYFNGVNLKFEKRPYRHDMTYNDQSYASYLITGSAVCDEFDWVACEPGYCNTTAIHELNGIKKKLNWDVTTVFVPGMNNVTLVKRRACQGGIYKIGMTHYASVLFLIFASMLYFYYISKRTTMLDEENVTASDYSIVIKNPPPDAYNPDEWRDHFAAYDLGVTVCTICVDNSALVRKLMTRRIILKQIRQFLPNIAFDVQEEEFQKARTTFENENLSNEKALKSLDTLTKKLGKITIEIKDLQKREYKVKRVFLTFETEAGQRAALLAFKTGKLQIWSQLKSFADSTKIFKNKVLSVAEAEEPSSIRYLDLQVGVVTSLIQTVFTFILTAGITALAAFLINKARQDGQIQLAGYLTIAFNSLFPVILKRLMMAFEQHKSESTWQASLYLRLTLFRWVITSILPRFFTTIDRYLGTEKTDLLPAMSAILLAELWMTPLLSYLDLYGTFMKHIVAPRSSSQTQMNLAFKGSYYNLAERYTSLTNIVFLCYMYCALNPLSYFICAGILLIQFQMDKFALTRIWYNAPLIGTKMSKLSRIYFLLALVICVGVSSYDWSRFRYDNVCLSDPDVFPPFPIWMNATDGTIFTDPPVWTNATDTPTVFDARPHRVSVNENKYCDFSVWRKNTKYPIYPLVPLLEPKNFKWMTISQERLSRVYGWTSVGFLVLFLVFVFGYHVTTTFFSLFHGISSTPGQDQTIDFSCTDERGFVPQQWMFQFDYNLIACEMNGMATDKIKKKLIGWELPNGSSYDDHNVIFDVPYEGMKRKRNEAAKVENNSGSQRPIFSIVKHWPVARGANS